jgi:hypothetical protein
VLHNLINHCRSSRCRRCCCHPASGITRVARGRLWLGSLGTVPFVSTAAGGPIAVFLCIYSNIKGSVYLNKWETSPEINV